MGDSEAPDSLCDSHYVTRFLTADWESGQKMLRFYDFDQKRLRTKSSRSLFARPDWGSKLFETRLKQRVEDPIALMRRQLTMGGGPDGLQIKNRKALRALYLLLFLQGSRADETAESHRRLEEKLSWDEAKLDQFAAVLMDQYWLVRLRGHPLGPLFYNSNGLFAFPARRRSGTYAAGIAMPINHRQVVAVLPKDVEPHDLFADMKLSDGGMLTNASIGTSARRVVIHPAVLESYSEDALCERMEDTRKANVAMLEACWEFNRVVDDAFRKFGLK